MAAKITSPLCLAFFHLPKLSLTIFECFSGFPQPRWGFFVIANPTGVKQSFFCRQDCHDAIAPRNDVPLAWIATALSRLAMTRCQQGLLWLCIPETGNLRFHSGSIPGRDNSSKGTSSQDSWGFASLKLGISDSVVEVSLEGTIRLREQVPKAHGQASTSRPARRNSPCEREFQFEKNSPFEKNACESLA